MVIVLYRQPWVALPLLNLFLLARVFVLYLGCRDLSSKAPSAFLSYFEIKHFLMIL